MYTFWREQAVTLQKETGANQTFAIQHVGENLIQQGIDKGGNPLGIAAGNQQCQYTHVLKSSELMLQPEVNFTRVDDSHGLGKRNG